MDERMYSVNRFSTFWDRVVCLTKVNLPIYLHVCKSKYRKKIVLTKYGHAQRYIAVFVKSYDDTMPINKMATSFPYGYNKK